MLSRTRKRRKNFVLLGIVLVILISATIFFAVKKKPVPDYSKISNEDYKNISYTIEDKTITLKNGLSEEVIPGEATKNTVKYFGNEVKDDFDGDGLQDVAFLLTEDNGGSGIFYYLVAAINTKDGYIGTKAILLGDRISPQSTEFKNGEIIVNYVDRSPNEPMTTKPSFGKTKYFKIIDNELTETIDLNR
ncbi:MAG: hypothetical protein WCO18_00545 [bacterium]